MRWAYCSKRQRSELKLRQRVRTLGLPGEIGLSSDWDLVIEPDCFLMWSKNGGTYVSLPLLNELVDPNLEGQ